MRSKNVMDKEKYLADPRIQEIESFEKSNSSIMG